MSTIAQLEPDELARVSALPLFAEFDSSLRKVVLAGFERLEFAFGENVVREGDAPDGFYVIHEGSARVIAEQRFDFEVSLGLLEPGDSFGEVGVVTGEARSAGVRSQGGLVALRLDHGLARALLRTHPGLRAAFELETRTRLLADSLRLHPAFGSLTRADLVPLLGELEERMVQRGEIVIREGEPSGPMFLVKDGKLRTRTGPAGGGRDLRYLRTGAIFGELALLKGGPRSATVEAVTDSILLSLNAEAFQRLMREHETFRTRIEELARVYDEATTPTVPLDFAAEILPPDAGEAATIEDFDRVPERAPADPGLGAKVVDLDEDGSKPPASVDRRRFALVRQVDEMDCGVACLAMICRHFGHATSTSFLRHHVGTTFDGTSLRGLQRGGEAAGLEVRTVKASRDKVDDLPLPAVIHWGGNHWVVLLALEGDRVFLADPGRGKRRVDRGELAENWSGYAALASPTLRIGDAPVQSSDPRWLFPFIKPYTRTFALVFALTLVAAAVTMVIPVLGQQIIDRVIAQRDYTRLHVLSGLTFVLLLAGLGISLIQRRLMVRATLAIDGQALDHVSGKMFDLPLSYFESRRFADIERRLGGVSHIRSLLVEHVMSAAASVLTLLAALVVMFVYSWKLALAFIAITPFYALLIRVSSKRLRPVWEGLEEANAKYSGRQLDAVQGIATVKTMGAELLLRSGLRREFTRLANTMRESDLMTMRYDALIQTVAHASSVLFMWLGALVVLSGDMTIGELLAFNSLMLLASGPLSVLLGLWDQWSYVTVLLQRLQDVFDTAPEMPDDGSRAPVRSLAGRVTMTNVCFHFPATPATAIVEDFTLDVEPGMTVALVGRSGSGKSTLLKLIAGLLVPTSGTIAFDRVELNSIDIRALRRRLGVVLQEPYLFDETIGANIAFGDPDPDIDTIRRAAEMADAAAFIERLPLGYDTKVGASGIRLSGGQEQRLAIARSVYHEPSVLLFDEATSALDTESERAVKRNLDTLMQGRTAFVVAHRLSTVRDADLIVVMERGRIAETGTHEELMARGGLYAHLQAQQLAG